MTIREEQAIKTREQLADFVDQLRREILADPAQLENIRTEDYLEAMSAYLRAFPNLVKNGVWSGSPDEPSWALFAAVLAGAIIYE